VYHTNKASLPQYTKDLLPKLRQITVIGVESITTTLSLGSRHEQTPEDVSFEETHEKYTVFFSRTGGHSGKSIIDMHICRQLSRLLDVDMMMLFTCISQNAEDVHRLFEFMGIGEIPPDDDIDGLCSWLQGMLHPNEPLVPAAPEAPAAAVVLVVPEQPPGPTSSPLPLPPPSPSSLSVYDTQQFPPVGLRGPQTPRPSTSTQLNPFFPSSPGQQHNGRPGHLSAAAAQSSVGVAEYSQFVQRCSRSPQALAAMMMPAATPNIAGTNTRLVAQAQALLNRNMMMVTGTSGNPVLPPFGNFNVPPMATEESDLVGVMGEHYVRFVLFFEKKNALLILRDRCTKCLCRCWTTLGLITGLANYDTVYLVSRHSAVQRLPMLISRTTTRADSSRASGLVLRKPRCGRADGRGIILK
jgi:hypothetical protein